MERKLVSIQKVTALAPIEGADKIVKARVMGWDVVVKKDEFVLGDSCVFFEIDSVLPDGAPWAEFMRPRGFRVRTLRLRGVLSQGLALPVAILEGTDDSAMPNGAVTAVGVDVTARLGVTKYEPVLPDSSEVAGPFPTRVPKTDEIRLQSALAVLDEMQGLDFYVTTKLDGSSCTVFRDPEAGLVACSRNWALTPGPNHVWRLADKHSLATRLPPGMALQGEVCGPGIQKNRLGLPAVDLFAFSAYDTRAGAYLAHGDFVRLCADLGVPTVPVERVVTGDEARAFEHTLERYLALAQGFYVGTKNRKEGIVVRPLVERRSEALGGRLSFKIINNDFLLKDED